MRAPGLRLRRLAARLCDETTMSRVVDPAVADLQHEDEEARRTGDGRRRASLARHAAVWKVLGYCVVQALLGRGLAWCSHERSLVGRTLLVAAVAGSMVTLLLALDPFLSAPARAAQANQWLMFLYLVPQAVAIAIPTGLFVAVVVTMRTRPLTARRIGSMAGLALLASGLTLAVLEWLVPEANQAFRRLTFGGQIARGMHELGLTALAQRSDPASLLVLHARLSLGVAPLALTALALGLMSRFGPRVSAAVLTGIAGPILYVACWTFAARVGLRAPMLAAWAPNLLLAVLAAALFRAEWRRRSIMPPAPDVRRSP